MRMGHTSIITGVLLRREMQRDSRKKAREDRGRSGRNATTSQGMPRIAGHHQKRGTVQEELFPSDFKGRKLLQTP